MNLADSTAFFLFFSFFCLFRGIIKKKKINCKGISVFLYHYSFSIHFMLVWNVLLMRALVDGPDGAVGRDVKVVGVIVGAPYPIDFKTDRVRALGILPTAIAGNWRSRCVPFVPGLHLYMSMDCYI